MPGVSGSLQSILRIRQMNKVVRLPDGRFITRKIVESDPVELANAKPEEIWTMVDGKSHSGKTVYTRQILVRDMETSHIVNTMKLMLGAASSEMSRLMLLPISSNVLETVYNCERIRNEVETFLVQRHPVYKTMKDELLIRLGKKQREKTTEDQQTKRCFNFD